MDGGARERERKKEIEKEGKKKRDGISLLITPKTRIRRFSGALSSFGIRLGSENA